MGGVVCLGNMGGLGVVCDMLGWFREVAGVVQWGDCPPSPRIERPGVVLQIFLG